MIIDLKFTIGYKCPVCDLFHYESLSAFDISNGANTVIKCECGESELKITRNSNSYIITAPCFICGTDHIYKINSKRGFIRIKKALTFDCQFSGYEICCVGETNDVEKWINEYSKELDSIVEEDFEDFFINDSIVFESVEKIKDLEEAGKLYCECGSHKIEIELLSEYIELKCVVCSAKEIIQTVTKEQLDQTLSYKQIILSSNNNGEKKSKFRIISINKNL